MRTLMSDLGAGLLFFAVLFATNDIYKATAAGVALGLVLVGWSWRKAHRIEPLQWLGLVLVLVMGGATILFHDPRFVMFKPTVLQACVGVAMLKPGWMFRYLSSAASARMPRRRVVATGYVYSTVMLGMAVLNAIIATYTSQEAWALYNAVGPVVVYSSLGCLMFIVAKLPSNGRKTT